MATPLEARAPAAARQASGGVREVGRLAYPIVLTQMSQTVMHVVDSIFVGQLGAAQLGALGFAGIWLWTVFSLFNGCATGVQTFVSQAHGAGEDARCGRWAWQGFYAVVPITAIALFGFVALADPLFARLGTTDSLRENALAYLHMRPLGFTGFAVWIVLDHFFDWRTMADDVVKRPWITVGVTAMLLLAPLAATSTTRMVKRLGGAAWRRLHRLAGLLELADQEFVAIRRDLEEYAGALPSRIATAGDAVALDHLSLEALLGCPEVEHVDRAIAGVLDKELSEAAFFPDYLLKMLAASGIATVAQARDGVRARAQSGAMP